MIRRNTLIDEPQPGDSLAEPGTESRTPATESGPFRRLLFDHLCHRAAAQQKLFPQLLHSSQWRQHISQLLIALRRNDRQ